jgi:hypothetical protein
VIGDSRNGISGISVSRHKGPALKVISSSSRYIQYV